MRAMMETTTTTRQRIVEIHEMAMAYRVETLDRAILAGSMDEELIRASIALIGSRVLVLYANGHARCTTKVRWTTA